MGIVLNLSKRILKFGSLCWDLGGDARLSVVGRLDLLRVAGGVAIMANA